MSSFMENPDGTLSLNNLYGKKGDIVHAIATLHNQTLKTDAFGLNIAYDPKMLEFLECRKGDLLRS